jgi:hypothetical protein
MVALLQVMGIFPTLPGSGADSFLINYLVGQAASLSSIERKGFLDRLAVRPTQLPSNAHFPQNRPLLNHQEGKED